jgi:hypothetical protein
MVITYLSWRKSIAMCRALTGEIMTASRTNKKPAGGVGAEAG